MSRIIFFNCSQAKINLVLLCKPQPLISITQKFLVSFVTFIHLDMVCLCSCNCTLVALLRIIFVAVVLRALNI